jgi:hypothetical protein
MGGKRKPPSGRALPAKGRSKSPWRIAWCNSKDCGRNHFLALGFTLPEIEFNRKGVALGDVGSRWGFSLAIATVARPFGLLS